MRGSYDVITNPCVHRAEIARHYDLGSLFYRLLWGPHIHHGLWLTGEESPREAQEELTRQLARRARIRPGEKVLDVGCGLGGSSLWLARHCRCEVLGVTLSGFQRNWAAASALLRGLARQVRFRKLNAEAMDHPAGSWDVLWSIECTEHLFDKAAFFHRAAGWLRPGGRVAICAWLAGPEPLSDQQTRLVQQVCRGFLCPSLASAREYLDWFHQAGLVNARFEDWTPQVMRTWELCQRRTRRLPLKRLAAAVDQRMGQFLEHFETIHRAYATGAMQYGCLLAEKPPEDEHPEHKRR